MNFQYSDIIIGHGSIDLIPYKSEHVVEYNKWLQNPEIQELTETEPCTLDEEYQYQKDWEADNQTTKLIKLIYLKDSNIIIGDVNLFFQADDKDIEINIMIADLNYRGKGFAKEALDLMIDYLKEYNHASPHHPFKRIIAKILNKNVTSIRFFERYGFVRRSENETNTAFDEPQGIDFMEEEKFFITERILDQSEFKGIHGILKHRSTDFVVEEVDPEGRVVEFSADCVYADPDLERKPNKVISQEVKEEEVAKFETDEQILEELTSLFEDAEFAKSVLALASMTSEESQVIQNRVIADKDHRKRIHMYFKCHFGGKLVTDVVAPTNFFRVSLKKKTGNARPLDYDHRNNQGPNDPKPVPFLEFSLWKDGLDTMEAVQILSKRLLMPAKSFSYAGTKDRRSVSVQRIVVRNAFPAKIAGINKMTGMRMKVSHLQAAQGPLRFGDLSGNRFTILLRNCHFEEESTDFRAISETLSEKGFINYYGLQRFGRGGGEVSTDAIGRALLSGNFEAACSMILDPRPEESNKSIAAARTIWKETGDPSKALEAFPYRCSAERAILQHFAKPGHSRNYPDAIACINRELRLMYVHAVQSLWWNAGASKRAQLFGVEKCVVGDLVMDEVSGNIQVVTLETLNNYSIFDVVIPIMGHATQMWPQHDLGVFMKSLLEVSPEILQKDKWKHLWDLPGGYRNFLQKPKGGFEMKLIRYNESEIDQELSTIASDSSCSLKAVQLRFTLPTSAYATMLLREIFPKNSSTSGDYHKTIQTS